MQKNKRNIMWFVNFNQQRNIRVLRANYDNKIFIINNIDKNCYAVFKNYYQLYKEERREADIKIYYSIH